MPSSAESGFAHRRLNALIRVPIDPGKIEPCRTVRPERPCIWQSRGNARPALYHELSNYAQRVTARSKHLEETAPELLGLILNEDLSVYCESSRGACRSACLRARRTDRMLTSA